MLERIASRATFGNHPVAYALWVLRVTVLELPARYDDRDGALREIDALLESSSSPAPESLVVIPEMAFVGYVSPEGDFDLSKFAEPLDGPTIRQASELASRHRTHLVVPLVLREGSRLYNASVVVGPRGQVVTRYKKRHPWFPETWAAPGEEPTPLIEIAQTRVTFAVCYDVHFLAEEAEETLADADLLVFTSAWVDDTLELGPEGHLEDTRVPLLRSLASEHDLVIANANWGEGVVRIVGQGGSCIIGRDGGTLAQTSPTTRRVDHELLPRPRFPASLDVR